MADLTQIYTTAGLLGVDQLNGAEGLHLTTPAIVTTAGTYYKLAAWFVVFVPGDIFIRLTGSINAVAKVNGVEVVSAAFGDVTAGVFTAETTGVYRLDLEYTVIFDSNLGYVAAEIISSSQQLFASRTDNMVGAITTNPADDITDEQLGPQPDPDVDDPRLNLPVFPFDPNWRYEISDVLTWLTDVMASESDAEQRMRLRPLPRRTVEATYSIWGVNRQKFNMYMAKTGRGEQLIPLWWDRYTVIDDLAEDAQQLPGGPFRLEFHPGTVVHLSDGQAEALATVENYIDGVITFRSRPQQALTGRIQVTPMAVGQFLDEATRDNLTGSVTETRMRFTDFAPAKVVGAFDPSAGGEVPVFLRRPNYSSGLTFDTDRQNYIMDNGISKVHVEKNTDQIRMRLRATYHSHSRQDLQNLRSRIWAMQGRYKGFRLPTYTDDVTLSAPIFNAQQALLCEPFGYTENGAIEQDVYRYVLIQLWDGRNFVREITDSEIIGQDEWLYLNQSIGTFGRDEIRQICFVPKARLDTDAVEFTRLTDDKVTVALTFKIFDDRRQSGGGEFDLTYLVSSDDFYLISFDDYKLAGAD